MFIEIKELKSAIYEYQMAEISEGDNDILLCNIDAAVIEVKSYLRASYDVDKIFGATGKDRNPLILELTKSVAVWYIIRLSNVDIIYQQAEKRYQSAIDWLDKVRNGLPADLPLATDTDGTVTSRSRFGSNEKFNSSF